MVENPWAEMPPSKGPGRARCSSVCLTEREIEDRVFNRLPAGCREAVEEHLIYCTACLEKVEAEEQFAVLAKPALREWEQQHKRRSRPTGAGWLGWLRAPIPACAGALALGGLMMLLAPWNGKPAPAQRIQLNVSRGVAANSVSEAAAGRPVQLSVDLAELPKLPRYHLQLVNMRNEVLAGEDREASGGELEWNPSAKLAAGTYWVRLYEGQVGGKLLREFGLRVK